MNAIAKNHRSKVKHLASHASLDAADVLVSMRAMALCPFAETMTTEATDDRPAETIVGLGAAGVVLELPRALGTRSPQSGLRVGDEVWFRAGFSATGSTETVSIKSALVQPVPLGITLAEAATLGDAGLVALASLKEQGVTRGTRVLIHSAANPFGHAAVAFARLLGADVAATVETSAELPIARAAGASAVAVARSRDAQSVLAVWAGARGADLIFDSAIAEHMPLNIATLANNGVISACPVIGRIGPLIGMEALAKKNGHVRFFSHAAIANQDFSALAKDINAAVLGGAYRPLVGQVFQPREIDAALARMTRGRLIGNVVIAATDPRQFADALTPIAAMSPRTH